MVLRGEFRALLGDAQTRFKSLHGITPFGLGWPGYGVLVTKQTFLFNRADSVQRFKPINPHQVFAPFWVVRVPGAVTNASAALKNRDLLAIVVGDVKIIDRHPGFRHNSNANVACVGNIDPDAITWREHLQAVAVPTLAPSCEFQKLPRVSLDFINDLLLI